jgi:hypothetical protein
VASRLLKKALCYHTKPMVLNTSLPALADRARSRRAFLSILALRPGGNLEHDPSGVHRRSSLFPLSINLLTIHECLSILVPHGTSSFRYCD